MTTVTSEISARELMEQIVTRAAIELVETIKRQHKGNENLILREIKALHGNTTTKDLPEYLQKEITRLTQAGFQFLNGKGFMLVPKNSVKRN